MPIITRGHGGWLHSTPFGCDTPTSLLVRRSGCLASDDGPDMSLLDRLRPDTVPTRSPRGADARAEQVTVLTIGFATGVGTAAVSWLVVALPVLLAWATSAQASASWGQAVRVATDLWLGVHRVPVDVPGGSFALAPLGLTLVPVWLCWVAGRRLGASAAARAPRGKDAPPPSVRTSVVGLAVGYAVVLGLGALAARSAELRPHLGWALAAGFVLALVSGGLGAYRGLGEPLVDLLAVALRLPDRFVTLLRGAAMAAAALVACGALLLTATVAVHLDRVIALHHALDPGTVGGGVLTLGEVALMPNGALWCVAFLAGPGVSLGTSTLVSAGGSSLGLLPLVPVLGAVPAPGPFPAALWAVVLVPVVVGILLGWWVAARGPGLDRRLGSAARVVDALSAALLAAATLTVLMWLSGGSAGPGVLSDVGPSAWRVGLALAGELGAGAALGAWVTSRRG
ncbi:DUF6350 family protein [Angustibacter sp. McL0619]|uniref:cell division protein PerM n=1 Tax=Angustibacter sp. McL0619 TaxID=3415676 RepID=UPI003CF3BA1C